MSYGVAAVAAVAVLITTLLLVRYLRWRILINRAIEPQMYLPQADGAAGLHSEIPDKDRLSSGRAAAEGAASVFLPSAANWFWLYTRVDPDAILGVSAASAHIDGAASIDDTFSGFATWAAAHPDVVPGTGAFNRMVGYVGEQQAADGLAQQGYLVTQPEVLPNNPGWDFLVDSEVANVKTYTDARNVAEYVEANPDVTYVVNSDADNLHLLDDYGNVIIGEYTHAGAENTLQTSVEAAQDMVSGEFVTAALDTGVPITLIAFVTYRQVKAVREGKRLQDAFMDGGLEIVVRGTGIVAGGMVGAEVGALVDVAFMGATFGAFSLAGGVAGGVAGSVAGAKAIHWWKVRPARAAREDLNMWLTIYGEQFTSRHVQRQIEAMLAAPLERSQRTLNGLQDAHRRDRRSLSYWIWPTPEQALRAATMPIGDQYVNQEMQEFEASKRNWREIANSPIQMGAAMANAPAAAAQLDVDPTPLDAICEARQRLGRAIQKSRR